LLLPLSECVCFGDRGTGPALRGHGPCFALQGHRPLSTGSSAFPAGAIWLPDAGWRIGDHLGWRLTTATLDPAGAPAAYQPPGDRTLSRLPVGAESDPGPRRPAPAYRPPARTSFDSDALPLLSKQGLASNQLTTVGLYAIGVRVRAVVGDGRQRPAGGRTAHHPVRRPLRSGNGLHKYGQLVRHKGLSVQ
jgi:hypothetical protein